MRFQFAMVEPAVPCWYITCEGLIIEAAVEADGTVLSDQIGMPDPLALEMQDAELALIERQLSKLTARNTVGITLELIRGSGVASDIDGFRQWLCETYPGKYVSRSSDPHAHFVEVRLSPNDRIYAEQANRAT